MLTYRRDIDGLRALAVLPVLLCHAHIAGFRGGFVGVDVFFVISGFLITSILLGDLQRGEFSLWRFYERRCRRILPPLIVVVLVSAALAMNLLAPAEFRAFAKSAMWLSFFSSNIGFNREVGYFDPEADTKPLLHTWSLAVEEQFYVLFPILLYLGFRFAKAFLPALLVVFTVASMLLSFYVTRTDASDAFYLIHYRGWELAFGSLLAFWAFPAPAFTRVWLPRLSDGGREALALAGVLCILLPVGLYSDETMFPGAAALPPCLGAFLIIWTSTGGTTLVGKALSKPPAVGIGRISYALYLWHWPLLVFAKTYKEEDLSSAEGLLVLAVSVVLSAASLRLVEAPFRSRALLPGRSQILATSVASLLVMGAAGFAVWNYKGLFSERAGGVELYELVKVATHRREGSTSLKLGRGIRLRTFGSKENAADSVLIIGDSFANHWNAAARDLAKEHGIVLHLQHIAGCPSLVNTTTKWSTRVGKTRCLKRNRLFAKLLKRLDVGHVVLASNWPIYHLNPKHIPWSPPADKPVARAFERQLDKTIRLFVDRGASVWVMLEPPQFPYRVPGRLFRLARAKKPLEESFIPAELVRAARRPTHALLERAISNYDRAKFLDPIEVLCEDGSCITVDEGHPLYQGRGHLSYHGSVYAARVFEPVVSEILASRSR